MVKRNNSGLHPACKAAQADGQLHPPLGVPVCLADSSSLQAEESSASRLARRVSACMRASYWTAFSAASPPTCACRDSACSAAQRRCVGVGQLLTTAHRGRQGAAAPGCCCC